MRTSRRRARKGEGTVYQTTRNGRQVWVAEIQWTDHDGIERRRSAQRATERAAVQALNLWRLELASGKPASSSRPARGPRFGEYAHAWLDRRKPEIGPNTYRQYEGNVRLHLRPRFGGMFIRALAADDVTTFLADERIGQTTRRQCLGTLRQILSDAVEDGIVERMPFRTDGRRRVKVRVERKEMHVLDEEQQRAFVDAASGDRLEALWVLALASGMREGELLGLHWSAVKGDHVMVQRRLDSRTRERAQTKSKSGIRRIDLDDATIAHLEAHRLRMRAERAAYDAFIADRPGPKRKAHKSVLPPRAGSLCRPHDLVFLNTVGQPISATNMTKRWFKALLEKAGLPNIRFHDLRHSHATLLLSHGINPKYVQERLGHESVKTTLDLYGHVLPTAQRQAADLVGEVLGGRSGPRNPRQNPRRATQRLNPRKSKTP